ncbi:MAG TPA: DUF3515 family protein [Segeticoccus sp.]|nr:DUF3515 family protein [Segeticoccus sp.]
MRRSRAARSGGPAVLALLVAAVLGACSSPVEVTPAPRADSAACEKVSRHWPRTVGDLERTRTTSESPSVAAWGDPAVIARCGVRSPGPTTDTCISASGVDWVAHRLSDGYRFITFGRSPAIEVLVPHDYAPEPLLLGAFDTAAKQVPAGPHHCS